MADSVLLGVLLFVAGLLAGAGWTFVLVRHNEAERLMLHRVIGQMQRQLELQAEPTIPAEEM